MTVTINGTTGITTPDLTSADDITANGSTVLTAATSPAALPLAGGTLTGNVNLGDNVKAIFGAGSDLEIYHDGTNNRLTLASANTYIQTDGIVHFTDIGNNEKHLTINDDGAVQLYHNNAEKLATTATGISVTGNATFPDGGKANFGNSNDLQIYHDGTQSFISEQGPSSLNILSSNVALNNPANTENMLTATEDGAVTAYYNGAAKLATTATGIDVTGTTVTDGLTAAGAVSITNPSAEYYATSVQINNTNTDFSGAMLDMRATSGSVNTVNGRFLRFYADNGITERFHVKGSGEIYTAAGVNFGGAVSAGGVTSTSNVLDDYEEGTWSPTTDGTSATVQKATYTKVGNRVHISLYLTGLGGSTGYSIHGLPFTPSAFTYGPIRYHSNSANYWRYVLRTDANSTTMRFLDAADATVAVTTAVNSFMVCQFTYQTDS